MTTTFTEKDYALPFFKQEGFVRKHCPKCGEWYWTQNASRKPAANPAATNADSTLSSTTQPPKNPSPSPRCERLSLRFFEKNGHTRIKPYPVVARWRKDIYLTHASIIDFQPYVTEGISPPPANPLVISQPSIRLTDISNTGPTFGQAPNHF